MSLRPSALALAILGALALTTLALLSAGVAPLEAYRILALGAFSTPIRFSDMVMLAAPRLGREGPRAPFG